MDNISLLDEILSYLQFIFVTATLFLVIFEFKEVYIYEQEDEEVEGQEDFQENC